MFKKFAASLIIVTAASIGFFACSSDSSTSGPNVSEDFPTSSSSQIAANSSSSISTSLSAGSSSHNDVESSSSANVILSSSSDNSTSSSTESNSSSSRIATNSSSSRNDVELSSSQAVILSSDSREESSSSGLVSIVAMRNVSPIAVRHLGRSIEISGLQAGENYALMDMQGRLLQRGNGNGATVMLRVAQPGRYVVRVSGQVQTVLVH